ncbi:hypothetical protein BESB_054310 [Besnoitia besnoiti]|uniref:Uncharacterized protein n=1 Tax=Besnoitia besnoiti TaxID=94643 RepID=A0A2A9MK37_BESBE|nr:hypothetical protein BESB_054310 [Besnoitia besnoiti]PFH35780.1 hypothetical protein BESB_054310 [Besnoitia besnoiti]
MSCSLTKCDLEGLRGAGPCGHYASPKNWGPAMGDLDSSGAEMSPDQVHRSKGDQYCSIAPRVPVWLSISMRMPSRWAGSAPAPGRALALTGAVSLRRMPRYSVEAEGPSASLTAKPPHPALSAAPKESFSVAWVEGL